MSANRPLADFLSTITIKAKDFATEITVFNTKEKDLATESSIEEANLGKTKKTNVDVLL